MTGIATLTGRFSVAVGTIREASNVIPCIVLLLLAVNPPSPEVVHDRAPVPPGRASWYDHIDTNWPMMFRIASACHSPASRPAPSVQARKGGRYPQNSSREAKIQNYRNSDIDRTIFGGGRNDKGGSKTWLRIPFSLPYCCTFLNCEFKTACAASR